MQLVFICLLTLNTTGFWICLTIHNAFIKLIMIIKTPYVSSLTKINDLQDCKRGGCNSKCTVFRRVFFLCNSFFFETIPGKRIAIFKRFLTTGLFVVETHTNKYGGTKERNKKNPVVYFLCEPIIRATRQVAVHSSKAVAFLCRAIKMD